VNGTPGPTHLHDLLDALYRDRQRLSGVEIQRRAAGMELPPVLRRLVDALPGGDYDRDQAGAALERIQTEEGMWRDETRVPLADLDRAMATSGVEGQFDDPTGNEAGPAEEFGDRPWPGPADPEGEPDPDSAEGRRLRPSPEGRSGPN
jgi:hypothetical protein